MKLPVPSYLPPYVCGEGLRLRVVPLGGRHRGQLDVGAHQALSLTGVRGRVGQSSKVSGLWRQRAQAGQQVTYAYAREARQALSLTGRAKAGNRRGAWVRQETGGAGLPPAQCRHAPGARPDGGVGGCVDMWGLGG